MDRQLIDYLPMVLQEVPELKELLKAWQPELEMLWSAQKNTLDDQFIPSAGNHGLSRWEKILGLFPKDTDTLEMRRTRILSILRLKLPYSVRWLENWLNELCGIGNYELEIKDYTISLELGLDNIPDAERMIDDLMAILLVAKPANMILDYTASRRPAGALLVGGILETVNTLEILPQGGD